MFFRAVIRADYVLIWGLRFMYRRITTLSAGNVVYIYGAKKCCVGSIGIQVSCLFVVTKDRVASPRCCRDAAASLRPVDGNAAEVAQSRIVPKPPPDPGSRQHGPPQQRASFPTSTQSHPRKAQRI